MPQPVRYLVLLLVGLVSGALRAEPVRFRDPVQAYDLFQSSTLLEVQAGTVSINDLLTRPDRYAFVPTRNQLIKPFRHELGYWLRVELTNETADQVFLHVVYAGTEQVVVYEVGDGAVRAVHKLGTLEPERTYPFQKSTAVAPTQLRPGQTHAFYIYMQGIYTTALPIYARSTNNLLQYTHEADLFYGLYYGFILIIIVYSLILFSRLGEADTLRYAIWVFFLGLQLAMFRGHINEFFWPSNPVIEQYAAILSGLAGLAHLPFTLAFLRMRQLAPILFKIGLGIAILYAVGLAMNVLSIYTTGHRQLDIVPQVAILEGLFSIWAGIILVRRGFRPALYYVIGNVAFFASIFIFLLYAQGQLPHSFWTYNSLHLGSGVEIILFTTALTYKVNLLKEQQDKAVREQLRPVEANRQLIEQQNTILEEKVKQRTDELSEQKEVLQNALTTLRSTQAQLIQQEKLASLGELTAGIAHEIQNPLNFVNNFAEVSVEMVDELVESLKADTNSTTTLLTDDIRDNLQYIVVNGRRASNIVRSMLEHTRTDAGTRQLTDLNVLANEYMRLSYHGLRAKDETLVARLLTEFDANLPLVDLVPQPISRVLLNLFNNAFYAVFQKAKQRADGYQPTVLVRTEQINNQIRLTIRDNGAGIPAAIRQKIFNPFFTTKPAGQGTGLGLSLSYDIITHGHGGRIDVHSEEGSFSEFSIYLPQ